MPDIKFICAFGDAGIAWRTGVRLVCRYPTWVQSCLSRPQKGKNVLLAGLIGGTIKFLVGFGVVIGLVVAFVLMKLFKGRS